MPKKWAEKLVCVVCILAISTVCVTSIFNKTKSILGAKGIISSSATENSNIVSVDWKSLYPVKETASVNTEANSSENESTSIVAKYCDAVEKLEDVIDGTINCMPGYNKLMEFNGMANKLLGKKTFSEGGIR